MFAPGGADLNVVDFFAPGGVAVDMFTLGGDDVNAVDLFAPGEVDVNAVDFCLHLGELMWMQLICLYQGGGWWEFSWFVCTREGADVNSVDMFAPEGELKWM